MHAQRSGDSTTCPRALCVVLAALALGHVAWAGDAPHRAQAHKAKAIEHLKRSQGRAADKQSETRLALQALGAARALLALAPEPVPAEITRELQEVNSLIYWARKMMPVGVNGLPKAAAADVPEGQDAGEIAHDLFREVEQYALQNPDAHFMIAVRFFEVADRFTGTEWSLHAQRLSLEHMRLVQAGDRAETKPGAEVDRRTLLAHLEAVLGRAQATDAEKITVCDRFVTALPDDPVRAEVGSIRAVLAGEGSAQFRAAREYVRRFPDGELAEALPEVGRLAREADAFDALVVPLKSEMAREEKMDLSAAYLKRFPSGAGAPEVRALTKVFSARSQHEAASAWLVYRLGFPEGALRDRADDAIRRSETVLVLALKDAVSSADEDRLRRVSSLYVDLLPRGTAAAEVRSLARVFEVDPGDARLDAARKHVAAYPGSVLSRELSELARRWERSGEAGTYERLRKSMAVGGTDTDMIRACDEFLKAHPAGTHVAEVRAARRVVSLRSPVARLKAAKDYLARHPAGAFAGRVREIEEALVRAGDDELHRAATAAPAYAEKLKACERYLSRFPDGAHAGEMRALVRRVGTLILEENAAFERLEEALRGVSSPDEGARLCAGFLAAHRGGSHASHVAARKREFGSLIAGEEEKRKFRSLMSRSSEGSSPRLALADDCLKFLRTYPRSEHRQDVVSTLRRLARKSLGPHAGEVRAAAFSPDSQRLVTIDADAGLESTGVWVWDPERDALVARYATRPGFTSSGAALFLSEDEIALGETGGRLAVWDLERGRVSGRYRLGTRAVVSIAVPSDRSHVVTALKGDAAALSWDSSDWTLASERYACSGGVSATAGIDGLLALGGRKGGLVLYRAGRSEPLWSEPAAHNGPIDSAAIRPDGGLVVTASATDGTVRAWDARGGERGWLVKEKSTSLAFAGRHGLVTGPSLRSAQDGRILAQLAGNGPVAASADGRFVFTAGKANEGVLWYVPALLAQ